MKFGCEKNFSAECKKNLERSEKFSSSKIEHSEKFSKKDKQSSLLFGALIKIFQTNEIWL
jgi:hypothetical protein